MSLRRMLFPALLALAACMVGAGSASAAPTSARTAGTVSVSAKVNPLVVLDIATPSGKPNVDFGIVTAGSTTSAQDVGLVVRSNRRYSLSKAVTDADQIGLTTTLSDSMANPKTDRAPFTDAYALDVPASTPPGEYRASVLYTVVQE